MIPSYHYYYDTFGPICGYVRVYACMCYDFIHYCRWYLGARPVLFIADIEMLKVILVKEFDSFVDREVSDHMALESYVS